jgi:hypothetical protein
VSGLAQTNTELKLVFSKIVEIEKKAIKGMIRVNLIESRINQNSRLLVKKTYNAKTNDRSKN